MMMLSGGGEGGHWRFWVHDLAVCGQLWNLKFWLKKVSAVSHRNFFLNSQKKYLRVNRIQGTVLLLANSRSRAISWITRSGAPFWKGECLGYNTKSNLCREARVDIECRPFEVQRSVWQIHWHNWLVSIVGFVRRKLGNFRETWKLQRDQTHKTQLQPSSWHTGHNPSVSSCEPLYDTHRWHLSFKGVNV